MKSLDIIPFTGHSRFWLFLINLLLLLFLSSCSSSDSPGTFTPQNNLEGKVFVFGAQVDGAGDLVLYINGTDLSGNPLTVADLQTASVTVGDTPAYNNNQPELEIIEVNDGDNFLSLSLLTDYSNSTDDELDDIATLYEQLLDNLPLVYEAQVITFSSNYDLKLDWTDAFTDLSAIEAAVALTHEPRDRTALFDSMGFALEGDLIVDGDGLIERCRPAHMLVVFTDGEENESSIYTDKNILTSLINDDAATVIMLGTSTADSAELLSLAGDHGAVVQVNNAASLVAEVANWSLSLQNMVKLTLKASTGFAGETVSITIGTQTTAVVDPSQLLCTPQ